MNLRASPTNFRAMKLVAVGWGGHEASMADMRNSCQILVGKPAGKGLPGRPDIHGWILEWFLE